METKLYEMVTKEDYENFYGIKYLHPMDKELEKFGIPENEVPIVLVAFGELLDNFRIAVSSRKDISKTNTFH